jgi:rsbT antagonist protein RsbS
MAASGIPLIRLRDVLLVAIQVDPSDDVLRSLRDEVAREIERADVRGVVVEVSGVGTFDSFIARSLRDTAQMARLMGAQTVVAGLDPAVAITLVEMGMTLTGVQTARDLDAALAMLAAPQSNGARGAGATTDAERDREALEALLLGGT